MIKRILTLAVLGAAFIGSTGCGSNGGFTKYKGIEYKIVKDVPGPTAKIGDMIEFNILVKVDTMFLGSSRQQPNGKPAMAPVDEIKQSGQVQAVFTKLSVGDSAIVQVSCDTILKTLKDNQQQQLPPWFKKGKKISYYISVVSIQSKEDFGKKQQAEQAKMMEEMKAKETAQAPIDDKMLQDYFAKNNIKAQKTADGLYYVITKPGTGAQITPGQIVSMKYTGKTLDGKAFDSNVDTSIAHHSEPLTFPVGAHQMIPGVDEGAALLKKGAKATLYLPSQLGYGSRGSGAIAPNSVLVFDIEVTDVKAAPAKPTTAPPAQ